MRCEPVINGAGTGKTAMILEEMDRLRQEKGLSPDEIAFATFTKSGCNVMAERAGRRWGYAPDALRNFRTVHGMAYRALGIGKDQLIAGDSKSLEWIGKTIGIDLAAGTDESGSIVYRALTPDGDDEAASLAIWDLARVTLRAVDDILAERLQLGEPSPPRETIEYVVSRYESAKTAHGKVDYSDIVLRFAGISMSLYGPKAGRPPEGDLPEGIRAVFIDECQDNSALVDMALTRLASQPSVERVMLVGDPMQSIFESFAGGSSKHFLGWAAAQSVMPKSYRCPRQILELGERCLQEMHSGYWDRQISPADHTGRITQAGSAMDAIEEHLNLSEETLFLARCGYSLQTHAEILEDLGIPFSRVGRQEEPELLGFSALWNLQSGADIDPEDWTRAIELFPVRNKHLGTLVQEGEKTAWLEGNRYSHFHLVGPANLEMAGCTSTLANIIRKGEWLPLLSRAKQESANKWIGVAKRHGPDLATRPRVRLATIHAAKGLEADTVILSTESSGRVERGRERSPLRHDEECRVNYVAVTRAKRKLVIVEDGLRERLILPW